MSEIERLRDELNRLRRISDEHKDLIGFRPDEVVKAIEFRVDEIARLEAEAADPWREAKGWLSSWRGQGDYPVIVAYIDHLTAENADLRQKYDLANETIKTATVRLNEVKAERDRLAARVAELEAAAIRVDFENGVATLNPDALVLDPARVLATAAEAIDIAGFMLEKNTKHNVKVVLRDASTHQKPYQLKGGSE